jgi:hypothetical protein
VKTSARSAPKNRKRVAPAGDNRSVSALTPIEPSQRRAALIARIQVLRDEVPVGRDYQRLIEPAAWGWFLLTFFTASLSTAGVALLAEHLPRPLVMVLTGVALYLSVVLVDALLAPARKGSRAPPDAPAAPARTPLGAATLPQRATAGKVLSWTIRSAFIALVLAVATLTALVFLAPDAPILTRLATFLAEQHREINRRMRAEGERPAVRGRTSGANWQLLEHDGRYIAAPLAEAVRLCAALGAGWQTPRLADLERLTPAPDELSTLHVWVRRDDGALHRASSAQIVSGSWRPTGFVGSTEPESDHSNVLCVRPEEQ